MSDPNEYYESPSCGLKVFILAKNEEQNIAKCLDALEDLNLEIIVLNSNSSDDTASVASNYGCVDVRPYNYMSHYQSYNEITSSLSGNDCYVMILDADMVVSKDLFKEIKFLIHEKAPEAIKAPVRMCVEGHTLRYGSLYPPKPFVFKVGKEYFEPLGHGEVLRKGISIVQTQEILVHDDRKPYYEYLKSQCRYSAQFTSRCQQGYLSWRDRIRSNSPFMIFLIPFFSFFVRLGFLAGRYGVIYALDRLIAEAIKYRCVLVEKLKRDNSK